MTVRHPETNDRNIFTHKLHDSAPLFHVGTETSSSHYHQSRPSLSPSLHCQVNLLFCTFSYGKPLPCSFPLPTNFHAQLLHLQHYDSSLCQLFLPSSSSIHLQPHAHHQCCLRPFHLQLCAQGMLQSTQVCPRICQM